MTPISVHDRFPDGTAGSVCYRCRRHQREDAEGVREAVVDTGINIDMEGGLAFCATCVAEMARAIGMLAPESLTRLEEALARAAADVEVAQTFAAECLERAEAADNALAALAHATQAEPGAGTKRKQPQPA